MFHTPGWMADMNTFRSTQDKSIDPKVAEGLVAAWRARDALALPPATVARIVDCVDRVARGRFFRYPQVRLNQINWNAELYACAAELTGNPELLRVTIEAATAAAAPRLAPVANVAEAGS